MKRVINIGMLALLLVLASCSTKYRMTTRIHKDGKVEKEVYASADSAFLAGNRERTPFLFQLGNEWAVTNLDSCIKFNCFGEEGEANVKAGRTMQGWGTLSFFSPEEEWMRPLAVPQEKLEKQFRWFYTYYTYTCGFQEISDKGPVPIGKHLNEQEQALLFRGEMSGYRGMNGVELEEVLVGLEQKFQEWLYHSQFELSYEAVVHFLREAKDTLYLSRVVKDKAEVFNADEMRKTDADCSPGYVCGLLDKRYATTAFSDLYKRNEKEINREVDRSYDAKTVDLFGYQMRIELAMPGKLLSANAALEENGMLVWKVDAYRFLAGNYVLKAESRTMNVWAFCVTGLLLLLAGYGWVRRK
ncbi:hypothetical protein [Phocaeicola sp.]